MSRSHHIDQPLSTYQTRNIYLSVIYCEKAACPEAKSKTAIVVIAKKQIDHVGNRSTLLLLVEVSLHQLLTVVGFLSITAHVGILLGARGLSISD